MQFTLTVDVASRRAEIPWYTKCCTTLFLTARPTCHGGGKSNRIYMFSNSCTVFRIFCGVY